MSDLGQELGPMFVMPKDPTTIVLEAARRCRAKFKEALAECATDDARLRVLLEWSGASDALLHIISSIHIPQPE